MLGKSPGILHTSQGYFFRSQADKILFYVKLHKKGSDKLLSSWEKKLRITSRQQTKVRYFSLGKRFSVPDNISEMLVHISPNIMTSDFVLPLYSSKRLYNISYKK